MTAIQPTQTHQMTTATNELYAFRDKTSGMWLRFYTPSRRYDMWREYTDGARRTYSKYRVENALTLPEADPTSQAPVFSVMTDDTGRVWAGWYANGPLQAVADAYAPREFASEPVSASLIAGWIDGALPEGVIELKGAWVDPSSELKAALADLTSRAFVHAMHLLGARYAYCTAAEHAAPRWFNSGAREMPGIVPAAYPDERYRTTVLWWDAQTALDLSTSEQRSLFLEEHLQATTI